MPITLSAKQDEQLTRWLKDRVGEDRESYLNRCEKVRKHIARWEAKSKPKMWPLGPRSSSIAVPTTAIIYDAIKTRIINALFGQDRDLNCVALIDGKTGIPNPDTGNQMEWSDIGADLQKYFDFECSDAGDWAFRSHMDDVVDEGLMTGTAFPYTAWETRVDRWIDPNGREIDRESYNNVRFGVGALEDYVICSGYDTMDRMPFMGHIYLARPSEMLQRIDSDGWNKEEIWRFLKDHPHEKSMKSPVQVEQAVHEGSAEDSYYTTGEIEMCEGWAIVQLKVSDKPAREVPVLVDFPLKYPEYKFRIVPWPYYHGKRKFAEPFRYIKRRKRLLGMGIPERLESVDEAISTVVNQIIDGGTLCNTPVWSVDENIRGVRDNLVDIYPGKIIKRGEDPNAVTAVKMGALSPDIFEGYNILREIAERLGKVTDYNLGRESSALKGEGTATTTLALLGESGQFFDARVRDVRATANSEGQMVLDLLSQYKPVQRIAMVLGEKRARAVLSAIALPYGELRQRLAIKVSFSATAATRELARQEEMQKWQLMQQYYQGLMMLADALVQVPWKRGLTLMIARDADRRIRALLESYNDRTAVESLPNFEMFVNQAQAEIQQQQNAVPPELAAQQQQMALQQQGQQAQLAMQAQKHQMDMQHAQQQHEMDMAQQQQQAAMDQQSAAQDMAVRSAQTQQAAGHAEMMAQAKAKAAAQKPAAKKPAKGKK